MIDEVKALRVEIASLTAERDQLRRSVGDLCRKYDRDLAAANVRAEKVEAGWRQAGYDYMRLKEAASVKDTEAAHWIALRDEQSNRAIAAEKVLAAARRECEELRAVINGMHKTYCFHTCPVGAHEATCMDAAALAAPGDGEEGKP